MSEIIQRLFSFFSENYSHSSYSSLLSPTSSPRCALEILKERSFVEKEAWCCAVGQSIEKAEIKYHCEPMHHWNLHLWWRVSLPVNQFDDANRKPNVLV